MLRILGGIRGAWRFLGRLQGIGRLGVWGVTMFRIRCRWGLLGSLVGAYTQGRSGTLLRRSRLLMRLLGIFGCCGSLGVEGRWCLWEMNAHMLILKCQAVMHSNVGYFTLTKTIRHLASPNTVIGTLSRWLADKILSLPTRVLDVSSDLKWCHVHSCVCRFWSVTLDFYGVKNTIVLLTNVLKLS